MIKTSHLFLPLARRLIRLLRSLTPEQWAARTCYPTWTVKDIAAHLLQTGLARLSRQRDGLLPPGFPADDNEPSDTEPAFSVVSRIIARTNEEWERTSAALSPRVITDLLAASERKLARFFKRLPPRAPAFYAVTWAGESASSNWFDAAREFTERWHHQAQIREAVGARPLAGRRCLHTVLRILMQALPFWYHETPAAPGTSVLIHVTGRSGGVWQLIREPGGWRLIEGGDAVPASEITLSQVTAWKLLTRSLQPQQARALITFAGDTRLCEQFLKVKAIMMEDMLPGGEEG